MTKEKPIIIIIIIIIIVIIIIIIIITRSTFIGVAVGHLNNSKVKPVEISSIKKQSIDIKIKTNQNILINYISSRKENFRDSAHF